MTNLDSYIIIKEMSKCLELLSPYILYYHYYYYYYYYHYYYHYYLITNLRQVSSSSNSEFRIISWVQHA